MIELDISGTIVQVMLFNCTAGEKCRIIYHISSGREIKAVCDLAEKAFKLPMALVFIQVKDWNRELSPWSAPAVFAGNDDFSGGGEAFLGKIISEVLPASEREIKKMGFAPGQRSVSGYSLGGMFALFAFAESGKFSAAASVSGSMWFEGFVDYMKQASLRLSGRVYMSLGKKEAKTANRKMKSIATDTEAVYSALRENGIEALMEWNNGGHGYEAEERIIKAFSFLLKQPEK